jgi:uncharacterized protein with HEPN domain
MKDRRLYLIHAQDCIARIREYTQGGKDEFMGSGLIQDAVLRNLEIMGESIKKFPEEWKQTQPQVEWIKVGDFRNVLAHDYLEIDLDLVWNIIENYLPGLGAAVQALMNFNDEEEKQG